MSRSNFDKPLTLDEAIEHAEEVAGACATSCQREHKQLADWLRELKERRKHGNAAAMREALDAVVAVGYPHNFQREAPHIRGYCYEITEAIKKCFAALSVPPRNCDVGTAEEQKERFDVFTEKHWTLGKTSLQWAQMPYEEDVDEKEEGEIK